LVEVGESGRHADDTAAVLLEIVDLVEEAFEAGIACVLGGDTEPVDVNESVEDVELRHQLLAPLIERSAVVKSWIERGALNRAVVNSLIEGSPN